MNKKTLLKICKENFYYYDIEVYKNRVVFKTWTKEARENNYTELEHNNAQEKRENYKLLETFINTFDFSFKTTFESAQELKKFMGFKKVQE